MANLTPIDKSTLFDIAEEIEQTKEHENYTQTLCFAIYAINKIQDIELQKQVLDIVLQDSDTASDKQCIEQLETFISTL
jgi:hypothetical protein